MAKITFQMFLGLVILILGLGFLLDNLNFLNFGEIFNSWWPILIILFAGYTYINSPRSWFGSLIALVFGGLLLLSNLQLIEGNFWSLFWSLLLISAGSYIVFGRYQFGKMSKEKTVDLLAFFGGSERRLDTKNFEGGNLTALFGAVKLDLRNATISEIAKINVFAAFGGAEVIVPENCKVEAYGFPVFGGWDDKTTKSGIQKSRLVINGTVFFGGIDIKN